MGLSMQSCGERCRKADRHTGTLSTFLEGEYHEMRLEGWDK
jgi:hypothetical protein